MKIVTKKGTPVTVYTNWLGQTIIETDHYKIKLGRFWNNLFCYGWKGYIRDGFKWDYVTSYSYDIIDNVERFISQMHYHLKQRKPLFNPLEDINI